MQYFLIVNGTQAGPYTWSQVKVMLEDKSITPETLYWREGRSDWQPLSTLSKPPVRETPAEQRIYSGFWRRLGALMVDFIVLGIFGMILGGVSFDFFCRLGSNGPLIGLVISWLYFGLQNSELSSGQTIGKRLMKIEVVGEDGKYISIGRSFLRYVLWGVPYFIYTPLVGSAGTSTFSLIVGTAIIIWFGLIAYLFIFNRPSRQVPHDLLVHTYVVRTVTKGAVLPATLWKPHFAIMALLVLMVCGLGIGADVFINTLERGSLAGLLTIQKAVMAKPEVQMASVMAGTNFSTGNGSTQKTTSLDVVAYWKGRPDDLKNAAREVAAIVLKTGRDEASDKDYVGITISYGYNIGIAKGNITDKFTHSLNQWETIVQNSAAP